MLQFISKQYDPGEGSSLEFMTQPYAGIVLLPNLVAGKIQEVTVYGTPFSGTATFTFLINGTPVSLGSPLTIADGGSFVTISGLDISVAKGSMVRLDLASTTGGGITSNITLVYAVEDGIPTRFGGTSATSTAIATGSKVFTTQLGLAYTPGSRIRIVSTTTPSTHYMEGVVTAYTGLTTSLTVLVDKIVGTGTRASWAFSIAGDPGTGAVSEATVNLTTAELATDVAEVGSVGLGRAGKVKKITFSGYARVTLYKTAALRDADSARLFGNRSYVGTQHGIILDVLVNSGAEPQTWLMSPDGNFSNGDTPTTNTVYYRVTNKRGVNATITLNFLVEL